MNVMRSVQIFLNDFLKIGCFYEKKDINWPVCREKIRIHSY